MLPIITIPNDTNASDISVIDGQGRVVEAADLLKSNPLIRDLVSSNIKLMADGETATISTPQVVVIRVNGSLYASVSFFCSVDSYGRKTSSSLVFDPSQKEKLLALLSHPGVPPSVAMHIDFLQKFIKEFRAYRYPIANEPRSASKKKTKLLFTATVFFLIFFFCLLALSF
jgi:hypothetical protein